MLSVVVLAVLWAIVVIPMAFQRKDDRDRDRSVERFGTAMRLLNRRSAINRYRAEEQPFVTGARQAAPPGPQRGALLATAPRRPVPAPREALMYPPDRSDMSAARSRMMTRRRRSLAVLIIGSLITVVLALAFKNITMWTVAVLFVVGLVGYLSFLRSQALRDRDRRESRRRRAEAKRQRRSYDITADEEMSDEDLAESDDDEDEDETLVRIDDDDVELHHMDTVDLTGLYADGDYARPTRQRRAG